MNVSYEVGDMEQNVDENRALLCAIMKIPRIVSLKQTHGDKVIVLSDGLLPDDKHRKGVCEGDALITNRKGVLLLVKIADCQSVFIYDPDRQVIANIHSGWRGSVKNIIRNTVQTMTKVFGCQTENMVAGIGPSLGPCCAEFVNFRSEIPERYWKYEVAPNYFDLWSISVDQLKEAGLLSENISVCGICTRCNTKLFYSYRGEGVTGRFGAVIGIKEDGI